MNVLNNPRDVDIQTLNNKIYTRTTNHIVQNIQTPLPIDPAETILQSARAVEATHISSSVSYVAKCHPKTRLKVIANIADWATGANGSKAPHTSIIWFVGPAGGGKTTIMRNVVGRCEDAGVLVVSYFFSRTRRGATGLTSAGPFVATITHQLTNLDPILKPMILDTIRAHPTIFEESLDFQMHRLVVEPLRSRQPPPRKIVMAIDGFDECYLEEERQHLLDVLLTLLTSLPSLIVIVLASRPELDLRTAFEDAKKLKKVTKVMRLQDYDGKNDIRIYLCDEFERIRTTHPLRNSIPTVWLLEEIIQMLVDKASGNFIYPVTVIKYINNPRRSPVKSLNDILALSTSPPSSGNTNPLAELDALYAFILHPPDTDIPLLKRILHCVLGLNRVDGGDWATPSFCDQFLGLPPDTTAIILCDLHSIVSVPDSEDKPITLHHKSLEDYLVSPERSLDLFQSRYDTYLDLTIASTTHMLRWASDPVADSSKYLLFSSICWAECIIHCFLSMPGLATLPDTILQLDPRILLKYRLVFGYASLFSFSLAHQAIHSLCEKQQHCLPLCQLLARIVQCTQRVETFINSPRLNRTGNGLEMLSRFESETGLYDPLPPPPLSKPPQGNRVADRIKRRIH